MAYELTALIGVGSTPAGAVPLPQGAWLMPLCNDGPHGAGELSRGGAVAQVAAALANSHRHERVEREFSKGHHAIKDAPADLGITAESPRDAFDTVGLGRYRHTEDWRRAIVPRPSL